MKKHGRASLVLAALVGGLAIHGLLVVCCGGSKPAGAQSSASCQQWAFVALVNSSVLTSTPGPVFPSGRISRDTGKAEDVTSALAPEGWEPVSYGLGSGTDYFFFRRCVR